jgi:hypothetical protein
MYSLRSWIRSEACIKAAEKCQSKPQPELLLAVDEPIIIVKQPHLRHIPIVPIILNQMEGIYNS